MIWEKRLDNGTYGAILDYANGMRTVTIYYTRKFGGFFFVHQSKFAFYVPERLLFMRPRIFIVFYGERTERVFSETDFAVCLVFVYINTIKNNLQFIFFTVNIFTGSKIKTPMKATNCDIHGSLIVYIAEIIAQWIYKIL